MNSTGSPASRARGAAIPRISLSGATGDSAAYINGEYRRNVLTDEDDFAVYEKVDDADMLIWQHESSSGSACSGEWRIVDDALLDVWIGHVIPAVLAAESGSDFLDTYGAMPVAVE